MCALDKSTSLNTQVGCAFFTSESEYDKYYEQTSVVVSANGTELYTIPTSSLNETIPCYTDTRIKLDGACFIQSAYDAAKSFAGPICIFVMVITGILMIGAMVIMIIAIVFANKEQRGQKKQSNGRVSKAKSAMSPTKKKQ